MDDPPYAGDPHRRQLPQSAVSRTTRSSSPGSADQTRTSAQKCFGRGIPLLRARSTTGMTYTRSSSASAALNWTTCPAAAWISPPSKCAPIATRPPPTNTSRCTASRAAGAHELDNALRAHRDVRASRSTTCCALTRSPGQGNAKRRRKAGFGRSSARVPSRWNRMRNLPGFPTAIDALRTVSVSRLLLDNVPHIKAYWVSMTPEVAQIALQFGADDVDGTIVHETIYRAAGSRSPSSLAVETLVRLIQEAGRVPVERDVLQRRPRAPAGFAAGGGHEGSRRNAKKHRGGVVTVERAGDHQDEGRSTARGRSGLPQCATLDRRLGHQAGVLPGDARMQVAEQEGQLDEAWVAETELERRADAGRGGGVDRRSSSRPWMHFILIARGAVRSVVVVAEQPSRPSTRLAVDLSSRTSIVLARLLLRARGVREPRACVPLRARRSRASRVREGARHRRPGLKIEGRYPQCSIWAGRPARSTRGCYFVFAAWCGRGRAHPRRGTAARGSEARRAGAEGLPSPMPAQLVPAAFSRSFSTRLPA